LIPERKEKSDVSRVNIKQCLANFTNAVVKILLVIASSFKRARETKLMLAVKRDITFFTTIAAFKRSVQKPCYSNLACSKVTNTFLNKSVVSGENPFLLAA
jgi:hypothetical protein